MAVGFGSVYEPRGMSATILVHSAAIARQARSADWLAKHEPRGAVLLAASTQAASEVARLALTTSAKNGAFGWQRTTLGLLAIQLSRIELAKRGLVPALGVSLEAVAARVIHARGGSLGRLSPIATRPGLPRALSRTLAELRLSKTPVDSLDPDLAKLASAFETELLQAGLADRATIFGLAAAHAETIPKDDLGAFLLFDVPLRNASEAHLVRVLAARANETLATIPTGDATALALTRQAFAAEALVEEEPKNGGGALERLQRGLFGEESGPPAGSPSDESVTIVSAPGESRECVEIARLVLREAARGTPLDRIAILLRGSQYGGHLEEAFARAKVPVYFARGSRKPDSAGRALLALLACASEGLSARRFAEYLSLGEIPEEAPSGGPPAATPERDRIVRPDEDALALLTGAVETDDASTVEEERPTLVAEEDRATAFGTLRAPRHWERLLVDAAVIGGSDRWERRLDGYRAKLTLDCQTYRDKGEDVLADAVRRDIDALDSLRSYALPLVTDLAALPTSATWEKWLDALEALATRAIRRPERVLAVLAELRPMGRVGPVDVMEVRLVLERRLSQILVPSPGRRYGKVLVATIDEARGLAFDVVFVPGLAEKIFPQKVVEDPLLLDDARRRLGNSLPTNDERTSEERLLLRLAIGAASRRVVLSYPRLDVEQARPRTPSFYGLEILRVAEGELRGFEHLAQKAAEKTEARIGWPAPKDPRDAIDEAEHDLALLESILKKSEDESVGAAHYLLTANVHLARALRFRGRRWLKVWKGADGLVDPPEEALAAIREHALEARSFSPTALQNFASCPYRFLLSAVHKLAQREQPAPIEDLDPLTRGSLVHEVQFTLLSRLRREKLLPVTEAALPQARALLDEVLATVAATEHDRLKPAIPRVWQDAIEGIAADLREWLRRMPEEPMWTPAFFELSFGLKDRRDQDAKSTDEPVLLDCGIKLRGSIDLVEKDASGRLRATDHKTGKVRAKEGETVIGKGETLQPVLYALTIEKLFPGIAIDGGRLYYCTAAGDFTRVDIPLTDEARRAAEIVAKTIGAGVREGFLPAAPAKDACKYCDFRSVCGPYEEIRTKRKARDRLKPLMDLRKHR